MLANHSPYPSPLKRALPGPPLHFLTEDEQNESWRAVPAGWATGAYFSVTTHSKAPTGGARGSLNDSPSETTKLGGLLEFRGKGKETHFQAAKWPAPEPRRQDAEPRAAGEKPFQGAQFSPGR